MFQVDTLFVISSSRGQYALDDLLASIRWTCSGSYYTIAVDETRQITPTAVEGEHQIEQSALVGAPSGFHRAWGVRLALQLGIEFRQAILLEDSCLIMGQGLDHFGIENVCRDTVGLLGIRDPLGADISYRGALGLLYEWELPTDPWDRPPEIAVDDFLILTYPAAVMLNEHNWLLPDNCQRWPTTFGAYLSWAVQMAGFNQIHWGHADKVLPPLYVSKCNGAGQPPPHILAPRFMVYSSVRNVLSYSEADLRELFKKFRGESARDVAAFSPVVAPGPGG